MFKQVRFVAHSHPVTLSLRPSRAKQDFNLVVPGIVEVPKEGRLAIVVLHSDMFRRPVRGDKLTDDVCKSVEGGIHQSGPSIIPGPGGAAPERKDVL